MNAGGGIDGLEMEALAGKLWNWSIGEK